MNQAINKQAGSEAWRGERPVTAAPNAGEALTAHHPQIDRQDATRGLADYGTILPHHDREPGAGIRGDLLSDASRNPFVRYGAPAMANSWAVLFIEAGQKGPRMDAWSSRSVPTAGEMAAWARHPAANMGCLLGHHPDLPENEHVGMIDMDVLNREARRAVLSIVRGYVPDTPLRHGDRAKGGAIFVRVRAEPGDAVTLQQGSMFRFPDTPAGSVEMVEVRGALTQAVVHGTHPSGVAYEWEGGCSIVEMRAVDLPCLTVTQVAEMVAEIDEAMAAAGGALTGRGHVTSGRRRGKGVADLPALPAEEARKLLTAVEAMTNKLPRGMWIAFCKAVHAVCSPTLGDDVVFDTLLRFTDRWDAAPGGADAEELRHAIREGPQLDSFDLDALVNTMRDGGWAAGGLFMAQRDFAVPANDNDMPGATGRAPKPPKVAPADVSENADPLAAMNRNYAYVDIEGSSLVICFGEPGTVPRIIPKQTFYDRVAPQKLTGSDGRRVPIGPVWFTWSKRRSFLGGVKMFPQGINGAGLPVPADTLNTWMGLITVPADADGSDWPTIRDYLREILCADSEQACAWVLNWIAHAVQFPHEKPGTALILRGPQGAGKTTLTALFRALFHSAHVVSADRPDALLGRFNTHLREALIVVADEAVFAGDPTANNRLKALVTDEAMTIEQKGIDGYEVESFHRFIMTSNEDHVLHVETDARRWMVLDVSGRRVGDGAYFRDLRTVLKPDHPEMRAFLRDLAAMPVDRDAVRKAPTTGGLIEQIVQSLPAPQQWIYETLRDAATASKPLTSKTAAEMLPYCPDFGDGDAEWPTYATKEALLQSYGRWKAGRRYLRGDNPKALAKLLEMFGPASQVGSANGSRRRVVNLGTLAEARAAFATAYLRGTDDASVWGAPDQSA